MGKISITAIGVIEGHLTKQAQELIYSGRMIFLQTEQCYLTKILIAQHIPFTSFDGLYQNSEDFDQLNGRIADALVQAHDAVFIVPGAAPGQQMYEAICTAAQKNGIDVELICSVGYGATACAKAGIIGANMVYASNAAGVAYDLERPLVIEELSTHMLAAKVKLALMEYYPDDWEILFAMINGYDYAISKIPLFELDRQSCYAHTTVVILPPVPFEKRTRRGGEGLTEILRILRAPGGCPWDKEQTHQTLRSDLLEETYEVIEAIDSKNDDMLLEELGDLLMQIIFHAQIAQEQGRFSIRDITTHICEKLIYRHPHVFASTTALNTAEVLSNWDKLKRVEKRQQTVSDTLHAVPKPLPALSKAAKLQGKAAKAGFDWPDAWGALDKVREETQELSIEIARKYKGDKNFTELEMEVGDLLFSAVNVARLCGLDAEFALMAANDKFTGRFEKMEALLLAQGKQIEDMKLPELDKYWVEAKKRP